MDLETRISQFEQLCNDDPSNDMAWFSLGGAYAQAERFADAASAYIKCYEANEAMSKAYQLAGQALINAGEQDRAAEILTKGFSVAAERGDLMPKNAMGDLLRSIGKEPPEVAPAAVATAAPPGSFVCTKTGKPGTQMPYPPFKGGVGAWIHEKISNETFDEWIGLGTKIINELRLDLSNDEHEVVYDYAMRRYIGLDDGTFREVSGGQEPGTPSGDYREMIDTMLGRMGEMEDFGGEAHQRVGS